MDLPVFWPYSDTIEVNCGKSLAENLLLLSFSIFNRFGAPVPTACENFGISVLNNLVAIPGLFSDCTS